MSRRRKSPPFVMLYHSMTGTPAWLDLSGNAVKLLVHMVKLSNGINNGEIVMSGRMAADAVGLARNTVMTALKELQEHGFVAMTAGAGFSCKVRVAPTWRLTFQPAGHDAPTHDYRYWKPPVSA
ncbi:hypothetical protein TomMM35A_18400 [Sphingobium sp. TomMM35A]